MVAIIFVEHSCKVDLGPLSYPCPHFMFHETIYRALVSEFMVGLL